MTTKKRYRYKRPPLEERVSINMAKSPRYGRILHHIWQNRFVTKAILATLLLADDKEGVHLRISDNYKKSKDGVSLQTLSKALQALWQNEYIEKWFIRDPLTSYETSEMEAYALGAAGAEYLTRQTGLSIDEIKYPLKPDPGKPHKGSPISEQQTLRHHLLISETIAALRLSCALSSKYKVVFSAPDKMIEVAYSLIAEGGAKQRFIRPDGFIVIKNLETGAYENFFIEADRSTEKTSVFKNKLEAYFNLPQEKHPKGKDYYACLPELYDRFEIDRGEKRQLPWMRNLRVLTVCLTEMRAKNLAKIARSHFRGGSGSNMFQFTDISRISPIEKVLGQPLTLNQEKSSQAIEGEHWFSGLTSRDGYHSLFEIDSLKTNS